MVSLGCSKNTVDAEVMLGETLDDLFVLESEPEHADIVIVNTCGFIEDARNEARATIAQLLELKKDNPDVKVVATGCWAERESEKMAEEFPELDAIWGLATPSCLRRQLLELTRGDKTAIAGIGKPERPREGARLLATPPSYAYLRLSDGCDNRCRYCAIPLIRGGLHSRERDDIVEEAKSLEQLGIKELVLIGQDTTAYGMDRKDERQNLADLLEKLLTAVATPRLRILYAHPAHLSDRVMDLLTTEPRLCRYLDLPVQHISDPVLAAMGRGYGRDRVMEILSRLSRDDFTLRTTLLLGHPGETEDDFRAALRLVEEGWFRQLGAFAYSPEPGTSAFSLPDRIPPEEAARRRDAVLEAQAATAFAWLDSRTGKTERILLDSRADGEWLTGRSRHEAPDADGVIFVRDDGVSQPGDIVSACIKVRDGYDLLAETPHAAREKKNGAKKRRRRP